MQQNQKEEQYSNKSLSDYLTELNYRREDLRDMERRLPSLRHDNHRRALMTIDRLRRTIKHLEDCCEWHKKGSSKHV